MTESGKQSTNPKIKDLPRVLQLILFDTGVDCIFRQRGTCWHASSSSRNIKQYPIKVATVQRLFREGYLEKNSTEYVLTQDVQNQLREHFSEGMTVRHVQ